MQTIKCKAIFSWIEIWGKFMGDGLSIFNVHFPTSLYNKSRKVISFSPETQSKNVIQLWSNSVVIATALFNSQLI